MKMKTMLMAALAAGTLLACTSPLLAQDATNTPPAGAPGGGGGGRLGDTNKLSDDIIAKVKPVLDDMIKKVTDLRADQSLSPEDRTTKRTAIMTEASDALKAIVTADQFTVIQPILQQAGRGGRRGGGGGAPPPPPPAQ
jgi:Spy/CpxP family protein refolding chaperone